MTVPSPDPTDSAQIQWLLSRFASGIVGVTGTVAIATDARLLAMSPGLARADADRLATVISAFTNLARGAGAGFELGEPAQVVIDLLGGFVLARTVNTWCVLGVVASVAADLDIVANEVTTFSLAVSGAITPAVVDELANSLAASA